VYFELDVRGSFEVIGTQVMATSSHRRHGALERLEEAQHGGVPAWARFHASLTFADLFQDGGIGLQQSPPAPSSR
jgi:hypothetical protein